MVDDNFYMDLCLKEAWKYQGLTYPNPAVGSLILDDFGKILSLEAHRKSGYGHAELNAISKAFELLGDTTIKNLKTPSAKHQYILKHHNNRFKNFTIYVTLEPCNHTGSTPPCSMLIKTLGFKRVVIGSLDINKEATGGANLLKNSGKEVVTGVLEKECDELLKPFKKWQQKEPYIFFKLAKTQNGVYSGGIISSLESRVHVHKLRDKTDLLVIGGNTVRVDRPTLDARLCDGKAPDVCIYSKEDNFDRDIPLFKVPDRKVFITDDLEIVKKYKFIMIEGGEGMLKATSKLVDSYLFFTAPHFKKGKTLQLDIELKNIHQYKNKIDTIQWFSKV
jgi:diaminohydroxyphosphoribosylaminopyrimidine deaminase/5-amino-6-(5-phosphoribosylamino)uracil reductase